MPDLVGAAGDPVCEVLRRACIKQGAFIQEQNAGALFSFIQIGRAPDDANPLIDQFIDHAPKLSPGDRIDANAWFVKQQQVGFLDEGAGKAKLLLHAAGKRSSQPVCKRCEACKSQKPLKGLFAV